MLNILITEDQKMKIKYEIIDVSQTVPRLKSVHDSEEECIRIIENTPKDLMSTVSYTIRKIWTNSRK